MEKDPTEVLELRDKLSQLWERLEEEPIIRSEFLRKHQGYGDKTAMALRKEISNCEERKRNNIKVFIEKMRCEIEHWWKECMKSDSEKAEFSCMNSDCYTEDSLTLHEMYVEKLQEFYLNNEKIFVLLKERSELWTKLSDLETLANEPNRYNNRGGKLLREEKERKKIAAQLPKVENQLILLSEDYTRRTNKMFTVFGESIEDLIENKRMEHKIDKQCQLSARKQARAVVTPKATTPSSRTRLFAGTKSGTDAFGPTFSAAPSKANLLSTPKPYGKRTPKLNVENLDPHQNVTPSTYGQVSTAQKKILSVNKAGSAIKRRSGQHNINTKIQKKLKKATPEILNASKSYANFKTHLAKNPKLRSSIAPTKRNICNKNTPTSLKPKIMVSAPTPPTRSASKLGATLKKATTIIRQNTLSEPIYPNKTPKLTRSSSLMSPSCLSNKLSTKNLPIII